MEVIERLKKEIENTTYNKVEAVLNLYHYRNRDDWKYDVSSSSYKSSDITINFDEANHFAFTLLLSSGGYSGV